MRASGEQSTWEGGNRPPGIRYSIGGGAHACGDLRHACMGHACAQGSAACMPYGSVAPPELAWLFLLAPSLSVQLSRGSTTLHIRRCLSSSPHHGGHRGTHTLPPYAQAEAQEGKAGLGLHGVLLRHTERHLPEVRQVSGFMLLQALRMSRGEGLRVKARHTMGRGPGLGLRGGCAAGTTAKGLPLAQRLQLHLPPFPACEPSLGPACPCLPTGTGTDRGCMCFAPHKHRTSG